MFDRTLAPALALGNDTVIKPPEDACLSGIEIAKLAIEAGFPPCAINLVTGYGHETGAALTVHNSIDFATFTGSPQVDVMVRQATAVNSIPCALELGGKLPQIVFEDADIKKAASVSVKVIVQNAGLTCSVGSRLLMQESVF
jgi:aldehyde dehydrogenase (NAD+)